MCGKKRKCMKSIKINTPTNINYCYKIDGCWFVVRKVKNGLWIADLFRENMLSTDKAILNIVNGKGLTTKLAAITALVKAINNLPKYYYVQVSK